ncbi:hypothetical protein F2Q68_00011705 [Brassica cretica]|uniref:SGF29 C-terminal domain-containing protein n=1 Tax=Brassica cretica TaxID=69181 RepID=A0A8S9KRK0_BRACR|nr:hypothetical protein F2Q68_00011705 [Brassica cretica]
MKVDVTRVLPLSIYASLKGEQVAARITVDDAEYDEWIVVKVINFDRETKEVEVFDEEPGDDEEIGGQRNHSALQGGCYKHTTKDFYDHIRYLLEFDDDEEDGTLPQRTVPFHYVVAVPKGHRQ